MVMLGYDGVPFHAEPDGSSDGGFRLELPQQVELEFAWTPERPSAIALFCWAEPDDAAEGAPDAGHAAGRPAAA